jgi:hypothetical protein
MPAMAAPTGVLQRRLDGGAAVAASFALRRPRLALPEVAQVAQQERPTRVVWDFPHHGDPTRRCGRWETYVHAKGAAWHARHHRHDCHRFACPDCRTEFAPDGQELQSRGWEQRAALEIKDRLAYAVESKVERGRVIHVVVSPPQDAAVDAIQILETYRKLKAHGLKTYKRANMRGGCLVFHHARVPSKWNARTRCVDGPHFHALGFGWIVRTREIHESTGWVVRNLGVRRNVFRSALYILSHCSRPRSAVVADPQGGGYPARSRGTERTISRGTAPSDEDDDRYLALAVTWWGTVSYNKLSCRVNPAEGAGRYCGLCKANVPLGDWFEAHYFGDEPLRPPDADGDCFVVLPGTGWRRLEARFWDRGMREEWGNI